MTPSLGPRVLAGRSHSQELCHRICCLGNIRKSKKLSFRNPPSEAQTVTKLFAEDKLPILANLNAPTSYTSGRIQILYTIKPQILQISRAQSLNIRAHSNFELNEPRTGRPNLTNLSASSSYTSRRMQFSQ